MIGVGRTEFGPSPLRTVQADLPHTALQLVVLPRRGLTGQRMGCFQAIQPVFGKEGIRPAMMIRTAATSLPGPGVCGGCFAASSVSTRPQTRNVVL